MRISGYEEKMRIDVIRGILTREKQMTDEIARGETVRYRSGSAIRLQKEMRVGKSVNTWFLRAGNTCTLNVQCTPGSLLRNAVHEKVGTILGPSIQRNVHLQQNAIVTATLTAQYPDVCIE